MAREILIVEDNEDSSALTEAILQHGGFSSVVAATGQAALDYCAEHLPALILLDLSLPDIDGVDVCSRLRLRAGFDALPIIALTAHSRPEVQKKLNDAGATDYLAKPFTPSQLLEVVRKHAR
jgi:CheY-like chemotaxis protein